MCSDLYVFLIVLMMLFDGENEEVGWRMTLQFELEKRYSFNISTIFIYNFMIMLFVNNFYKKNC